MILTFGMVKPEALPKEQLLALIWRARKIALELEGVYDLALYQTGQTDLWRCNVDLEGQGDWEKLLADQRFQRVWKEIQELGIQILRTDQLERQI